MFQLLIQYFGATACNEASASARETRDSQLYARWPGVSTDHGTGRFFILERNRQISTCVIWGQVRFYTFFWCHVICVIWGCHLGTGSYLHIFPAAQRARMRRVSGTDRDWPGVAHEGAQIRVGHRGLSPLSPWGLSPLSHDARCPPPPLPRAIEIARFRRVSRAFCIARGEGDAPSDRIRAFHGVETRIFYRSREVEVAKGGKGAQGRRGAARRRRGGTPRASSTPPRSSPCPLMCHFEPVPE